MHMTMSMMKKAYMTGSRDVPRAKRIRRTCRPGGLSESLSGSLVEVRGWPPFGLEGGRGGTGPVGPCRRS